MNPTRITLLWSRPRESSCLPKRLFKCSDRWDVLNQTALWPFSSCPRTQLQPIYSTLSTLAEGWQVWKKTPTHLNAEKGTREHPGNSTSDKTETSPLPSKKPQSTLQWNAWHQEGAYLQVGKLNWLQNQPQWRGQQDCWLLGRFYQREKSSCKHQIGRLPHLISIPGQSWSQDTLQGVWPRTAGLTLLLQPHCWKTNEKASAFI